MPSPVLPSDFGNAEPLNNAEFCVRFDRFLGVPALLRRFYDWFLTPSGAISEQAKAEIATYSTPTGMYAYFASTSVGNGWLFCDGREVNRADYPALFTQLGTLFGAGDGVLTFNLPDGRGRSLIGAGQGSGLTNRDILTKYVGEESHLLTLAELVAHAHGIVSYPSGRLTGGDGGHILNRQGADPPVSPVHTTESTGGGAAFNVIHPCLIGYLHIKT